MRKPVFLLTVLVFFNTYLLAQNSMTGDGFGGRGWYKAHNYQVGAYSAYTVCGDSNQLYAWGHNRYGELGNGTYTSTTAPVAVINMNNVKFYTTGYVSAVVKFDSSAWVWSYDWTGFTNIPQLVLNDVKFADGGENHVVFVKYDGTVWGAGKNNVGQLGNGTSTNIATNIPFTMIGVTNAVRAVAVGKSGESATFILLDDGTVKITGGSGWFANAPLVPVLRTGLTDIVDIKGTATQAFFLDKWGDVYSLGGQGSTAPPAKFIFPAGAASIVAISANNDGFHGLALDSSHNVYAWGSNNFGQYGDGTYIPKNNPVLVASNVVDIFAGETFSYILKSDSTLWATGRSKPADSNTGSIWMNVSNFRRNVYTQINPLISPMNLCAPKVWGVLPIKLSSFTCTANGNNAILNWQSAEEINAANYIVQYSNDGSSFTNIATVVATGSNSKYSYTQQQVSGTAFYRLKMMDKDGSFTYSEIRVVKFDNKAGFTIAPNPANSVVYLFTKNNAAIKSIQIVSVDGLVVKAFNNYSNGQGIDISHLAKGSYILKAIYKNSELAYGKFIKL